MILFSLECCNVVTFAKHCTLSDHQFCCCITAAVLLWILFIATFKWLIINQYLFLHISILYMYISCSWQFCSVENHCNTYKFDYSLHVCLLNNTIISPQKIHWTVVCWSNPSWYFSILTCIMDVWDTTSTGCIISMATGTIFGICHWRVSHGNRHKVRLNLDINIDNE